MWTLLPALLLAPQGAAKDRAGCASSVCDGHRPCRHRLAACRPALGARLEALAGPAAGLGAALCAPRSAPRQLQLHPAPKHAAPLRPVSSHGYGGARAGPSYPSAPMRMPGVLWPALVLLALLLLPAHGAPVVGPATLEQGEEAHTVVGHFHE